jgi:hypothetical protein
VERQVEEIDDRDEEKGDKEDRARKEKGVSGEGAAARMLAPQALMLRRGEAHFRRGSSSGRRCGMFERRYGHPEAISVQDGPDRESVGTIPTVGYKL